MVQSIDQSLTGFLGEAEKDIQKDLPRFNIKGLIGTNMDIFHKNPSHQRGMVERLSSTYKTSIMVGGRSFDLVANPVLVGPDDYRPGADRQATFLILRKDDLVDAAAVERAARALRSHFG